MAKINGENTPRADGMTVAEYAEEKKYKIKNIAVELNGAILRKADYGKTVIKADDVIEIVTFVGGG